jgi:hypothetical protein
MNTVQKMRFYQLCGNGSLEVQLSAVFMGDPARRLQWERNYIHSTPAKGAKEEVAKAYQMSTIYSEGSVKFDLNLLNSMCRQQNIKPAFYEWNFRSPCLKEVACSREDDAACGVTVPWGFGKRNPLKNFVPPTEMSGFMVDRRPGDEYIDGRNKQKAVWGAFTPLYIRAKMLDDSIRYWRIMPKWLENAVIIQAEEVSEDNVPAQLQGAIQEATSNAVAV